MSMNNYFPTASELKEIIKTEKIAEIKAQELKESNAVEAAKHFLDFVLESESFLKDLKSKGSAFPRR